VDNLKGIAIFDRLDRNLPEQIKPFGYIWVKKEIENYFCCPETLLEYADDEGQEQNEIPLFSPARSQERRRSMEEAIKKVSSALEVIGKGSPWDGNMKVSDDFLPAVFKSYFKKLGLPNIMDKGHFYQLVPFVPANKIDKEVVDMLDKIVAVA